MRQERPKVDQRSLHVMSLFAVVMALIVSVLPPAIIFYQGAQFQKGALTSSVHLKAIHVSALIGRNPEFWKFEGIRISDILMEASNGETYVVKLLDGELIEKNGPDVQANPQTEVSAPLFDSGVQIASITAKKSLFPVLIQSIILALLTFSLGALSYIALKTIPIRLIHRAINNAAFLASHDPLTQLPNRALFGDWLAKSIQQASQKNTTIAVLSLDLDRFKEVNDLFGHAIGDALLIQVTRRIEAIVKKTAFIARVGGDEFCIVQSLQPQPSGAACLSERLIAAL
jgi:GGDEF domain-containing protein